MTTSIQSEAEYINVCAQLAKLKQSVAYFTSSGNWIDQIQKDALASVISDLDAQVLAYASAKAAQAYCPQTGLTEEDWNFVG